MKIISDSTNQVTHKNQPQGNWLKSSLTGIAQRLLKECKKRVYTAKESFGYQKRDIVVYHVEEAREGLEEAKDQFRTALEHFRSVTSYDGGELEQKYRRLKSEYQRSQFLAKAVHNRINAIEDVAAALFDEWDEELDHYSNRALRSNSRQQLKTARQYYSRLIKAMKQAETKIHPVLAAFQDQVLFLKHNLNSQAIVSLQGEFMSVGINIAGLITAMEKSIHEANAFTNNLLESRP